MTEAERKRLDHVVLPRRLPGLALLERYFPSPADNVLDAELASFAASGDTILDPWSGTGWTARRAVSHGMRVVAAEASPFAQMAAQAFLLSPEVAAVDAAFAQLASSRRVDIPLRQHIEELYASRCPSCNRPVVVEEFIWPRDGDAPGRKVYRCTACDISLGGADERVAAVDEADYAKLGLEPPSPAEAPAIEPAADADEDLPPAPMGLIGEPLDVDEPALAPLGEPGGPPSPPARAPDPPVAIGAEEGPRYASTVRPVPMPAPVGTDVRQGLAYQQLQDRFPVLDDRRDVVDEVLDLYTSRNLYALQAIANKIDAEFHDQPLSAVFRLALAGCLLPASRLNGYPGRVASLRISGGHVRQPASRHHREVNVWRLFEAAYQDVRTALAALGRDRRPVRFAADLDELGGMAAANLLWIRCRPAVVGQYLPPESIDLVIGSPPPPESVDELSFEYLATAWLLGREAAETLRLEPLFGGSSRADGAEVTAFRHAMASAAGALKPGGWFCVLLEGDDPDRVLAVAVAGAAAELELVHAIPRESARSGDGVVLHFRRASAEDRLRDAVRPRPLRLGAADGHLTYPELAGAIERATGNLLRDRGEPAGLARIACAVLLELERSGLLRRLVQSRPPDEGNGDGEAAVVGRGRSIRPGRARRARAAGGAPARGAVARGPPDPGTGWRPAAPDLVAARAPARGRRHPRRPRGVGHLLAAHHGRPAGRERIPRPHLCPVPGHGLAGRGAGPRLPGGLRDGGGTAGSCGPRRISPPGSRTTPGWSPPSWTSATGSGCGRGSAGASRNGRGSTRPWATC